VVCVECLPADKPWDVVSVTRRSSGVAPRACVRVYARVLVPPNLYIHIHTYIHTKGLDYKFLILNRHFLDSHKILASNSLDPCRVWPTSYS